MSGPSSPEEFPRDAIRAGSGPTPPRDAIRTGSGPTPPPEFPRIGGGGGGLGSLAQAARDKKLGQAKGWLIAVGILGMVVNCAEMVMMPDLARKEVEKQVMQAGGWARVDRSQVDEMEKMIVMVGRVIDAVAILLFAGFVVMGFMVRMYPLPITVTALALFLAYHIVLAIVSQNPMVLFSGIIIKVIVIAVLIQAIKAASAYEKEKQIEADLRPEF